jgi:hypothetical protein
MQTKEEKRESQKKYRSKNKEKRKQYDIDNQERIRKQRIQWDIDNAEKIKKQQKEYKKNNQEKIRLKESKWRENNIDKIKQFPSNSKENRSKIYKKYHMNNKIKTKEYKVKKKYGITLNEVYQILDKQEGKCAICGTHQDDLGKALAIDHDHKINNVRGLLCDKCNRGLGHFNDDIILLQKAIEYLKNNN